MVGAIDCSPYYRDRIHPFEGDLYRGDHGKHSLTVQLVTALTGELLDVEILLGHNNDSGVFAITGMADFLQLHGIRLAADCGYGGVLLETPDDSKKDNQDLLALRAVVETPFAYVDLFKFASNKSHIKHLIIHSCGIMLCFQLIGLKCFLRPFRQSVAPHLNPIPNLTLPEKRPSRIQTKLNNEEKSNPILTQNETSALEVLLELNKK